MTFPGKHHHDAVISYKTLRTIVGLIGFFLPFVLAIGYMVLCEPAIRSSISSYYHTVMGDVFVGALFAIGVFMLSYNGPKREDVVPANLACLFAIGTALFPTTPPGDVSTTVQVIGWLHYASAAGLFLTLSWFALVLFRKTNKADIRGTQKEKRNLIYTICGYTMLACLVLIVVVALLPQKSSIHNANPVFWLEAVLIVAFGMSWLTKGEYLFGDDGHEQDDGDT